MGEWVYDRGQDNARPSGEAMWDVWKEFINSAFGVSYDIDIYPT